MPQSPPAPGHVLVLSAWSSASRAEGGVWCQDCCKERLTWLEPPRTGTVGDISWVPQHSRTTRDAHAVQDSTMALLGTRLLPSPPAACGATEERCAVGTGVAGAIPQPPARGDPLYPPALTLCPAPFPQGFPPSQPVPPGGRESRATDGPRSPRPAESKVGTGLGARRSCAHLSPGAPEPRAPSPSHRQLPGWGLSPCPPCCLPSSLQSVLQQRPGLSPLLLSLTPSSSHASPQGALSGLAVLPSPPLPAFPISGPAVSLQIQASTEAGDSGRPRAGGVLVGSTKSVAEQPPRQHPSALPRSSRAGGRLGEVVVSPASPGDSQHPACPDSVPPPPWTNTGQRVGVGPPAWVLPVPVPAPSCPRVPLPRLLLSKGNITASSGGTP